MRLLGMPFAIACAALVLNACGDDGAGGTGTPSRAIEISGLTYAPRRATVQAGTTVVWSNRDELVHTVTKTSGPGESFDSGNVAPGTEFEQTFDEPGRVRYVCTLHHGQTGSITVE